MAALSPSPVEVVPATTRREVNDFIKFQWTVYRNDPNWVPPLYHERQAFLNPRQNPFFEHAEVALFRARRDGRTVGTIAAIINYNHNKVHDEQAGFFGLFETIEDYAVAEALLTTACDWVRDKGMEVIRGPMNLSINDECGLLIDGFDSPPVVLMTYNPPYYADFIERFGFHKAMDLYAYIINTDIFDHDPDRLPRKFLRVAEAVQREGKITVRNVNMKDFDNEVERIKQVYNAAWSKNWGAVPRTDAEINHLAEGLKLIVDPDLVFIAEDGDRPVGVSLGIPDANQALLKARPQPNLWCYLWVLPKFMYYRFRTNTFRLMIMGVIEEYRNRGIDAVFYVETARKAMAKGYTRCEMSWILENNTMMNRIIQRLGGRVYKTYRIYELGL